MFPAHSVRFGGLPPGRAASAASLGAGGPGLLYAVEVGTGGTEVPFGSLGAAALLIARFCEYPGPVVEQLAELVFLAPGVLPGPVEFAGGVLADPVELGGGAGPRLLAFAGCVFPYPCGLEHP